MKVSANGVPTRTESFDSDGILNSKLNIIRTKLLLLVEIKLLLLLVEIKLLLLLVEMYDRSDPSNIGIDSRMWDCTMFKQTNSICFSIISSISDGVEHRSAHIS